MNINKFLFKKSWLAFTAFFLFALWAFWPSYYSDLAGQETAKNHLHGVAMTLWCFMLIGQAWLIRINKRTLHSLTGKLSYILVPFIILSTLNLTHFSLKGNTPYTAIVFSDLALMINAVIVFVIIYSLAIYHRKDPLTHARYMACTIFPMFTPITDRLIYNNFRPLVGWAPLIDGSPVVPVLGFILADLIVLGLLIWDWRANKRWKEFALVLGLLVAYHISVLTFHLIPAWRKFGEWFLGMPLS